MLKSFLTFTTVAVIIFGALALSNNGSFRAVFSSYASGTTEITHGPITGNLSDTTATIWVRLNILAGNNYLVKTSSNLSEMENSGISPNSKIQSLPVIGPDNTYKITFNHLLPNTQYYVNLYSNNSPILPSPTTFKTFATPGVATNFKFVILTDFGTRKSSQDTVSYHIDTFKQAASENPKADFVFLGGDFWHTNLGDDFPEPNKFRTQNRKFFKAMYSLNNNLGDYNDFVKLILPNYGLIHHFDDHDGGVNNMDKNFDKKAITLEVLNDFFPTYPMTPYGDWQKFTYGQADFFVLDVRSQRDSKSKSMLDGNNLGENGQLQWFLNGLKNSTATWKIVFTGVPFNPTGAKKDSWAGYPTERTKIVNFINDNKITGVVFISGDEHGGAIDNGANSTFPEMLVPSPNIAKCFTTSDPGKWSNGIYGSFSKGQNDPPCPGYGVVRVLTNPDRIIMRIRDDKGQTKLTLSYYLHPEDATQFANQNAND